VWQVEFAADAAFDFELIFDHLIASYESFGDAPDIAFDRAVARLAAIQDSAEALAKAPLQGTLRSDVLPDVRFVRRDKAVFWFIADEGRKVVQVLAVFFGAQDHINHMMRRVLERNLA